MNLPGRRVPGDRRGRRAAVAELERAPLRRHRHRHLLHGVDGVGAYGDRGDEAREARGYHLHRPDHPATERTGEGHSPADGVSRDQDTASADRGEGRQARLQVARRGIPGDRPGRLPAVAEPERAPRHTLFKHHMLHGVDRGHARGWLGDPQAEAGHPAGEQIFQLPSGEAAAEGHSPGGGRTRAGARDRGDGDIPRADRAERLKRRLDIGGSGADLDRRRRLPAEAERECALSDMRREGDPLHGALALLGGKGDDRRR